MVNFAYKSILFFSVGKVDKKPPCMIPRNQPGYVSQLLPSRIHPVQACCFCPNRLLESYATAHNISPRRESYRRGGWEYPIKPLKSRKTGHWSVLYKTANHPHTPPFLFFTKLLPRRTLPCPPCANILPNSPE
jgi:hypothetical protein